MDLYLLAGLAMKSKVCRRRLPGPYAQDLRFLLHHGNWINDHRFLGLGDDAIFIVKIVNFDADGSVAPGVALR